MVLGVGRILSAAGRSSGLISADVFAGDVNCAKLPAIIRKIIQKLVVSPLLLFTGPREHLRGNGI